MARFNNSSLVKITINKHPYEGHRSEKVAAFAARAEAHLTGSFEPWLKKKELNVQD